MGTSLPVLHVLDFDGVVCDGLDECLLMAWIAFNRLPQSQWVVNTIDDVPSAFKDRFRQDRNFVRHDGHFLMPFVTDQVFESAATFEAFYSSISALERKRFRDLLRIVRSHFRQTHYDEWIGMHRTYDPMMSALKQMTDFYIVSGKDSASISAILRYRNVTVSPEQVFGGQSNKVPTLLLLKQKADTAGQRIVFCDDNLANAVEARAIGIETFWARWGYHTAADLQEGERIAMRGIGLDEAHRLLTP